MATALADDLTDPAPVLSEFEVPTETATLGGGCFWCLDALYRLLDGVVRVESGYAGGETENPTYQQVCSGATGHIEVVQITFEPRLIDYREILEIFFTLHDPTTLDQQGNDTGTQYRSVIFYHSFLQEDIAEKVISEMANVWDAPIVTTVLPFKSFYPAEDYHQNYYANNRQEGYCAFVIDPKVAKLRNLFRAKLKSQSPLP